MNSTKGYEEKGVEKLGCIDYRRIEIIDCISGLTEIHKDLFLDNELQKHPNKWIFRAERRRKDEDELACRKCTKKSTCSLNDAEDNVVFRTSLEKAFRAYEVGNADGRKKCECNLNRAFKRKLHHYSNNVPADGDILEWLALIRHYFGPTRLLDCTYSFFIACFFAINEVNWREEQAEIWAIDANWLSYREEEGEKSERISGIIGSKKYNDFKKKAQNLAKEKYTDEKSAFHNQIIHSLMAQRKPCIYNITPFRLNERVIAQNGTFLLLGDTSKCFVRNLEGNFSRDQPEPGDEDHLKRVVVRFNRIEEKKNALRLLGDMGIDRAVLFPDLRGFAESLWEKLALSWYT